MKKLHLSLLAAAILSLIICEPALATNCPSGYNVDASTGYCVKSGCDDDKCTIYYNADTHDLKVEKNPNATGEIIFNGAGVPLIHDMTIGEGITQVGKTGHIIIPVDSDQVTTYTSGKLTLPESLSTVYYQAFARNGFHTVEFKSLDSVSVGTFGILNWRGEQNLIIPATEGFSFSMGQFQNGAEGNGNINVQCKGQKNICEAMLSNVKAVKEEKGYTVTTSYYAGDDGNGHWEEWSDNGKAVYADSSKEKLLGKYAFDGTQTASYKYDGAGNLVQAYENGIFIYGKNRYTSAEAAAAVKDGNQNTVSITW